MHEEGGEAIPRQGAGYIDAELFITGSSPAHGPNPAHKDVQVVAALVGGWGREGNCA
jgi:hypothetical protein